MVGKLREMTNAGLMDCKKALTEASGDLDTAVDILRKKGAATRRQESRPRSQRRRHRPIHSAGRTPGRAGGNQLRNRFRRQERQFRAFCDEVAKTLAARSRSGPGSRSRTAQVAKMGENIQISRHQRLEVTGNGLIAGYIHTGAKVGVLVEVGAGKEETVANDEFKQLVRDITLQIAAANPIAVSRAEIDSGRDRQGKGNRRGAE